jgi:hypothetical protein
MITSALTAHSSDALTTLRSNQCWIASTQVLCFSCAQFCNVQRFIFATATAIGGLGPGLEGGPDLAAPSRKIENLGLIYAQCIGMPTLADARHYYSDYDPRLDLRYMMNHCERCGARFSDAKLGWHPERIFDLGNLAIKKQIVLRHCVGPVLAIGCIAALDPGVFFAFSGSRSPSQSACLTTS